MQFDIRMTKEMGFNGARKHQKVEDPRFLYWADRMGFLVSGEMANAYVRRGIRGALHARVDRSGRARRQQPLGGDLGADQRELGDARPLRPSAAAAPEVALLADALDRPHPAGDRQRGLGAHRPDRPVRDPRLRADRARQLYEKYKDVRKSRAPACPTTRSPRWRRAFATTGPRCTCRSSAASRSSRRGTTCRSRRGAIRGVEKTPEAALGTDARAVRGDRAHPGDRGRFCYTQITDVEQEVNGLMTYDRKMKF
jgi:hypothetical protein